MNSRRLLVRWDMSVLQYDVSVAGCVSRVKTRVKRGPKFIIPSLIDRCQM